MIAEAEAEKAARIGIALAMAIEEQVRAYGGPQFQLTQQVMNRFAEAIEQSKVDVVPKIEEVHNLRARPASNWQLPAASPVPVRLDRWSFVHIRFQ